MSIYAKVKFCGGSRDGESIDIPCDESGQPLRDYDYYRVLDPTRPPLLDGTPATVNYMLVKFRDCDNNQFEFMYCLRQSAASYLLSLQL